MILIFFGVGLKIRECKTLGSIHGIEIPRLRLLKKKECVFVAGKLRFETLKSSFQFLKEDVLL